VPDFPRPRPCSSGRQEDWKAPYPVLLMRPVKGSPQVTVPVDPPATS
jgi:hypothetical protein